MSLATLAGLTVLDGLHTLPMSGSWVFQGTVELPDGVALPSGRVSLTFAGDGEPSVT